MKTFQVAVNSEDQQLPRQLAPPEHLEPPQQTPHQHTQMQAHQTAAFEVIATALLTDKMPLQEQQ